MKFAFLLFLIGMGFVQSGFSQIVTDPCEAESYPFTGVPEQTLCEQYPNFIPDITIGANTIITNSSQIGTSITGNVFIDGDFIIDNIFTFDNAIVKIKPGYTIIVQNNHLFDYLSIDNSKLFACDGLWKGIVLGAGAQIFTNNFSIIEDAEIAIFADKRSALVIQKTTFNRNRVGIQLTATAQLGTDPLLLGFKDNVFSCDAPLNGTASEITIAGVKLKNIKFYANFPIGQNIFTGLQNGIYAEGESTLGISNFKFENISIDGIYLEKAYLVASNCTFDQCRKKGINAQSIRKLRVEDNCSFNFNMGGTSGTTGPDGIGVFGFSYSLNSEVFIGNCNFNFQGYSTFSNSYCIYLKAGNGVDAGTSIGIFENDFTLDANDGDCIRMEGNFSNAANLRIERNNFIDCKEAKSLIHINDGDKSNLAIVHNTIDGNNTTTNPFVFPDFGIWLEGSSGQNIEVSTNTFVQDWSTYLDIANVSRGVRSSLFHNATFCENYFSALPGAFEFVNLNMGTQILSNDFIGGSRLLVLDGIIGQQGVIDGDHNGNTWLRKVPWLIPAYHAWCTSGNCDFSRIYVHTQQTPSSTTVPVYYPESVTPVSDWFTIDLEGIPITNCTNQVTTGNTPELLLTTIADGQLNEEPGTNWEAAKYLFRKLENEPSLISQYTAFSTFQNGHTNSPIGKFYEVSQSISEAFEDSILLSQVQEYDNQRTGVENEIITIDSLLELNGFNLEQKTLKKELLSELLTIDSLSAIVFSSYHSNVLTNLQAVIAQNQQITTTQVYENNEKVVNSIFLNALVSQGGVLTEEQVGQLLSIALQCPQEGGMAVYKARGILPVCSRAEYQDEFDSCFPIAPIEERSIDEADMSKFSGEKLNIYPNPALNEIHIPLAKNLNGALTIRDSFGRRLLQRKIAEGDTSCSLQLSFPTGIYYCSILWEDGASQTESFIVR